MKKIIVRVSMSFLSNLIELETFPYNILEKTFSCNPLLMEFVWAFPKPDLWGFLTFTQGMLLAYLAFIAEKGSNIVEIGCGRSSGMIAPFISEKKFYIIDIDGEKLGKVVQQLPLQENIVSFPCDSKELNWDKPINLLWIDGDHSWEGIKNDVEKFLPLVEPGGFMVVHDYGNPRYPDVTKYCNKVRLEAEQYRVRVFEAVENCPHRGLLLPLPYYAEKSSVEVDEAAFLFCQKV